MLGSWRHHCQQFVQLCRRRLSELFGIRRCQFLKECGEVKGEVKLKITGSRFLINLLRSGRSPPPPNDPPRPLPLKPPRLGPEIELMKARANMEILLTYLQMTFSERRNRPSRNSCSRIELAFSGKIENEFKYLRSKSENQYLLVVLHRQTSLPFWNL